MLTPMAEDGSVPLLDQFDDLGRNYAKSVSGLHVMFSRLAEHGFKGLTSAQCHEIDKEHSLYELIKGDLRVVYFCDDGATVICSQVFVKKGNKTPDDEKAKARRIKAAYERAKAAGDIDLV